MEFHNGPGGPSPPHPDQGPSPSHPRLESPGGADSTAQTRRNSSKIHVPWTSTPKEGRLCPGAAHSQSSTAATPHPQSGRPAPGLAEPGAPLAPNTHKTVIVSCLACPAPPSPTLPPTAAPHDEAAPDAAADVAPDAAEQAGDAGVSKGHNNAISTESSSTDLDRCGPPSSLSDGGPAAPAGVTTPLSPPPVCTTKTVNHHPNYDIPQSRVSDRPPPATAKSSFTGSMAYRSTITKSTATYPSAAVENCGANKGLSREQFTPAVTGWTLPPGGGLRGGAPLPGETAISNGTSGWGPPPSSGRVSAGSWGSAPPASAGGGAWGAAPAAPSIPEEPTNGQKLLNSGLIVSSAGPPTNQQGLHQPPLNQGIVNPLLNPTVTNSVVAAVHSANAAAPASIAAAQPAPAAGNTSWAAAAGKGLPPSEPNQTNGATNKQLEQLNSVREALFSQDGWGGQNVKQDTSWDVGGAGAPPVAPPVPVKQDAMQWQAPSTGRNDGTDLWKSTLSGVPQPPKSQTSGAAPWNHNPAHPADYKTWGEPDEDPNSVNNDPNNHHHQQQQAWNEDGPKHQPQQPWDNNDQGPSKPKEDHNGWNSGPSASSQWGGPAGHPPVEPRREPGWGAPPPVKPVSWNSQQQPPQREQWHNESPTIGRRMDDGGTSLWGKGGVQTGGQGGWKDMPIPNIGSRGGPPGPPSRMPPGPGMKPNDSSPWGQPQAPSRGWGDDPMNASVWDADKQRGGGDMGGWSGGGGGGGGGGDWSNRKPMRSSPSWEEAGGGGGMDGRWGSGRPPLNKEVIWGSKQFRILCDMGYRKEDVESALRSTNLQMEDALDMLNMSRGGPMPGRGMPPTDLGFPGPRADPGYDMRFPNPGMPPYPPSDMPPTNPSLQNNPGRGGMNPSMVQQMSMGGGPGGVHPGAPPRPSQSGGGTPSTSQLRLLVQQIQMAVQAGHLNAQILNQPLAPQTLLLLNQLLQQIKALQQCQQQHAMAQAAGGRNGPPNQNALLHISVQITKHKQQITNLQNQITAQQAQYLKSQQPQPMGGGVPPGQESDINLSLGNITLSDQQTGSKLNKWIKNDNNQDPEFSRAPGSSKSSTSQPSPNLLLDGGSTWSNGNNGAGGWPDSNDKNSNNANDESADNFVIPEFVPGKAWKGSSIKDPSEDPTLTPGSVSSTPLILQHGDKHMPSTASSSTTVENSLGLTSTTWSFGNNAKDNGMSKDGGWGTLPPSNSSNNLSGMGENLWGISRTSGGPKPAAAGGWPAPAGPIANGWSNGSNMPPMGSSWLLLKNLTAQIDGSTLRTLCMQHGPLNMFHLYLTHGIALAKYSNGSEAKKAQNALNNCVLGNTTILATVADEHEVENIVRTLSQAGGQQQARTPSTAYSSYSGLSKSSSVDSWSTGGLGAGSNMWGSGGGLGSSGGGLGGSVWSTPDDQHNRTTPLNSFLPPDLLSETM